MEESGSVKWTFTRREFLRDSGIVVTGLLSGASCACVRGSDSKAKLSFGMVTDVHYADTDPRGVRHYRESMKKLEECVTLMNDSKVDFLIELGDFKDEDNPATEEDTLKYLTDIEEEFGKFNGPRYHVLGNHDVDSISKEQFLGRIENTGFTNASAFYSLDSKGFHLVVLDANYKADGSDYDHGNFNWKDTNIPVKQLEWLERDLASSAKPVIAFVHQQLDITGDTAVRNADEVRQILEKNGNVIAVFQGHHHAGHYSRIEGIHYYTLRAMVDGTGEQNNSYAIVEVYDDHSIIITGYRRAISKSLDRA